VEFNIPTPASTPGRITSGLDGNLWFTKGDGLGHNQIGRLTPEGVFTEFPIPTADGGAGELDGITAGSDGDIWFTDDTSNQVGRITATGSLTLFRVPTFDSGVGKIIWVQFPI